MSASTTVTNNFKPVRTLVSSPITIVLTGGLLFVLLTGFFSFFFWRTFLKMLLTIWNNNHRIRHPSSGNLIQNPPENAGLDSKIIQSFPEFAYSVRDRGMDVQCSICLTDFVDGDTTRLMTTCNHLFHSVCVDLWFESHRTCPVCRRELNVVDHTPVEFDDVRSQESLTIIVHEQHPTTTTTTTTVGSLEERDERTNASNLRFWRSHSTGHSIVAKSENEQEEEEEEEIKIHIEISGGCRFENHTMKRKLYCVRGTYSVG